MISIRQHKHYMSTSKNLDTLIGCKNSKRRILKRLFDEQNGKCMWCDEEVFLWWTKTPVEFKMMNPQRQATYEHITPKSKGGIYVPENGGCACHECNSHRKDITYSSFKYLTADPKRYAKWKANRENTPKKIKKRLNAEKHQFNNIIQFINGARAKRERQADLIKLASAFLVMKKYQNVDIVANFFYNARIIKNIGEHYGLL